MKTNGIFFLDLIYNPGRAANYSRIAPPGHKQDPIDILFMSMGVILVSMGVMFVFMRVIFVFMGVLFVFMSVLFVSMWAKV